MGMTKLPVLVLVLDPSMIPSMMTKTPALEAPAMTAQVLPLHPQHWLPLLILRPAKQQQIEDNTSTVLAIVLPIFVVLGLVGAVVWNKRVKTRQGKAPISRASRENQNFEHHTVDPIPPAIDHGFHVSNPDHAVKRGSSQTYIEAAEDTPVWDPTGTPSPVMNSKELNQSESTEV